MKRLLPVACAVLLLSWPGSRAVAGPDDATLQNAARAITELDVERARRMLEQLPSDSPDVAYQRARLAIYFGDCDSAAATLATLEDAPEVRQLADLSRSCARAVAASVVEQRPEAGLWIRLQDDEDRALVPFVVEVVQSARKAVEQDFGIRLPRPLRIDLVRDLFTLSAVSGLPLEAAETTGTVAVARWGRVTMLSPRAASHGYPWEDTLAHEITHLALSRATADHAPLWLQEGLAKRQETRWRRERPFDREPPPDTVALEALLSGESVGVDKLGPSIAMLPTPYAASIAFAEVASFMEDWVRRYGVAALHLLLADLKGLGPEGADAALRSTTGHDLAESIRIWQAALLDRRPASENDPKDAEAPGPSVSLTPPGDDPRQFARSIRLGDLLFQAGAFDPASRQFGAALGGASGEPSVRWRLGRTLLASGSPEEAAKLFESRGAIRGPHAGWYALEGRFLAHRGQHAAAKGAYALGVALHPLLEDVACEGQFRAPGKAPPPLPAAQPYRALCGAARNIPRE